MKRIRNITYLGILLVGIFFFSFVSAAEFNNPQPGDFNGVQSYQPSFNTYYSSSDIATYWPIMRDIENDQCDAKSDFIIMIRPGGCTSGGVVRSDLLAEQNVPVFCQLDAIKINPLIKVSSIKSISFQGDYPEEIAGISFHPARAAIRTYDTLLGSPLLNNIGYVVIILKRNPKEAELPDFVSGNLTATIHYDAEEAYGVGRGEFYLPVMSDSDWESSYVNYEFWQGKGFLRATDIQKDRAKIALYTDKEHVFNSIILEEGATSGKMYFPGFYCKAGVQVKLNKVTGPEKQARLNVDGESLWVREGSRFLNDRCVVKKISAITSNTGSISISCPGKTLNLIVSQKGAELEVGAGDTKTTKLYNLRDEVVSGKGIYLGYIGGVPQSIQKTSQKYKDKNFIVLVKSESKLTEKQILQFSQKVAEASSKNIPSVKDLETELKKSSGLFGKAPDLKVIVEDDEENNNFENTKVNFVRIASEAEEDKFWNEILGLEDYFTKSDLTTKKLLDDFPQSKGNLIKPSEENLWKQMEFAGTIQKQETKRGYLEMFLEKYPDSKRVEIAREMLNKLSYYDFSKSSEVVFVNNVFHYIGVDVFKADSGAGKNAVLILPKGEKEVSQGDIVVLNEKKEKVLEQIVVKEIDIDDITLEYQSRDKEDTKFKIDRPKTLEQGGSVIFNSQEISVKSINVEKIADVSLIPIVDFTKSEANFSFKIGIEKRGIELSPDKTKEKLEELNKTIAEWEEKAESLGKLVKGMKGACYATASVLMLKSTFAGMSGKSLARQEVMKSYRQICNAKVSKGEFKSMDACYLSLNSEINNDVSIQEQAYKTINEKIEANQIKSSSSGGLFGSEDVYDTKKSLEELKTSLSGVGTGVLDSEKKELVVNDLDSFEQVKSVMLVQELEKSGASADVLKKAIEERNRLLAPAVNKKNAERRKLLAKASVPILLQDAVSGPLDEGQKFVIWSGKSFTKAQLSDAIVDKTKKKDFETNLKNLAGDKVATQLVPVGSSLYLITLVPSTKSGSSQMVSSGIYEVKGSSNKLEVISKVSDLPKAGSVAFLKSGNCENEFIDPKIKFYETGEDDKLPAIVPFDRRNGWYVKVPSKTTGLFSGNKDGYKVSGEVSLFYVCNVGPNHIEEGGAGDDKCQSFYEHSYENVQSFGGCALTPREVQDLARNALNAVRIAAQNYGKEKINIPGMNEPVEAVLTSSEELYECQDFMSPRECQIMFNVCDPVICPSSRCNFGGKHKVANVVQSGIIGSIALCLPNFVGFGGDVIIPVCLTGIHAGIENYISILKNQHKCLTENLENGEYIGICDEMTAFYKCEFFWRQFAPVLSNLGPKLVSGLYGNSGKGGGEYLTAMHSWDNLQKGVDYFKDNYAQNAFRAFELRSVESVGGEFCKAFVGTSVPDSGSLLDSLLEPESPVQFYAHFSERLFTEATVPATSHYKVFYQIYAGKDTGAHYRVYLKDPPASGYYYQNPVVTVRTGYLAKGEGESESIDFTAPAGYKELCVQVNAQEWCGFGQVSTSEGLNYLQKKYVQDQVNNTDINSEKECISGSPSLWAFASPNVHGAIEQTTNPDIALKGIVRVCSHENPGGVVSSSSGSSQVFSGQTGNLNNGQAVTQSVVVNTGGVTTGGARWVEVGYCNKEEGLKCWLDTKSVKDDLAKLDSIEDGSVLSDLQKRAEESLAKEGTMTPEETEEKLSKLKKEIEKLEGSLKETTSSLNIEDLIKSITDGLDEIINRGFSNFHRAQALFWKADVYRIVARALQNGKVNVPTTEDIEKAKEELDKIGEEIEGDGGEGGKTDIEKEFEKEFEGADNAQKGDDWGVGFTIDDEMKIYDDDVYLDMYLEEDGEQYIIKGEAFFGLWSKTIGRIKVGGEIVFSGVRVEDKTDAVKELEKNYLFNSEGFVLKGDEGEEVADGEGDLELERETIFKYNWEDRDYYFKYDFDEKIWRWANEVSYSWPAGWGGFDMNYFSTKGLKDFPSDDFEEGFEILNSKASVVD